MKTRSPRTYLPSASAFNLPYAVRTEPKCRRLICSTVSAPNRTMSRRLGRLIQAANLMGQRAAPLLDGTVAPPIAGALIRAVDWMSSSITRESYDDKFIDLCNSNGMHAHA